MSVRRLRSASSTKRTKNDETKTCPIVGIGASAGGLEAVTSLLNHLPIDTGFGFVLVQHLDPEHESALTQLLALRPGRYSIRFEERFDEPEPVTPFLWTLICNRTGTLLTSTDNEAAATEWKERNLEFTVPVEGCFSQTLRLSTNRRPKQGATAHYRSMRLAATPSPHEATQ